MNWYLEVWKKCAQFSGRARRKEYWLFTLFNMIICIGIILVGSFFVPNFNGAVEIIFLVYGLAQLIPNIAVFVRRLHDTNHSGWSFLWYLLPIVGPIIILVFLVRDSDPGKNQYGPNPKGVGDPWDHRDELYDYQGQNPKAVSRPWGDDDIL